MKIFKIDMTKYIILSLLSLFLVISCTDSTTSTTCKDTCNVEGEYSCNGKDLQVCKKQENSCLALEKVKECATSCENNSCIGEETCDPTCKDYEICEGSTCKLQIGKCNTKDDCNDGKVCDETHSCVEVSNDCNPTCKDYENCINKSCSLKAGRCNTKDDCENNQICDETNSCKDEIKNRKTKISIGANQKMNSNNFKAKINLGKVRSSKDMKSTNFKLKLGTGIK